MLAHVVLLTLHFVAASASGAEASTLRALAHAICGPGRTAAGTELAAPADDGGPSPSAPRYDCPLCSALAHATVDLPAATVIALLAPRSDPPPPAAAAVATPRFEVRDEKSRGPPLYVHA